jgi:hypothetical protein
MQKRSDLPCRGNAVELVCLGSIDWTAHLRWRKRDKNVRPGQSTEDQNGFGVRPPEARLVATKGVLGGPARLGWEKRWWCKSSTKDPFFVYRDSASQVRVRRLPNVFFLL